MQNPEIIQTDFKEKYNTIVQILFELIDSQIMIGELGRGSGKTTEIIGSRMVRMAYDMPGASIGIGADTYVSLWQNIIPSMLTYFRSYYKEGVHFVVGKRPPKFWNKVPVIGVDDYSHTISTCWGTVFQLISADRVESALSKNFAHVIVDELLRIKKERFLNRIFKAVRGNRSLFGRSHYFGGFTGFSSTPDIETDETWFMDYETKVNQKAIKDIIKKAWMLNKINLLNATGSKNDTFDLYKQQLAKEIRELRRKEVFYLRASSFSNIKILGMDYIRTQFEAEIDPDIFDMAVLGIRKSRVKNMFFSTFSKENMFDDSYVYPQVPGGSYLIDKMPLGEKFELNASYLKYYDKNKPLYLGVDWGGFMSMVVAQRNEKQKEFRFIKNFYVYTPEQHADLAEKFDRFFAGHKSRRLILHYDRAGNARNKKESSNQTDAVLLKAELEKRGWGVSLMSIGQRVVFHWQHYQLCHILFSHKNKIADRILFCKNQCEELISSINHSPLKKTDGVIELDKSSERKLPFEAQAMYSTQIATAMTYLIWGEYERFLKSASNLNVFDYSINVV